MRALRSVLICFSLALLPLAAQPAEEKEKEKEIPEKNPFDSAAYAAEGRKYFVGHCAFCHGPSGEGGRGVNLTTGRYRHGGSDRELYKTINKGIQGSEMPGFGFTEPETWKIVSYVRRLGQAGAEEKASGDPQAGKIVYESKGACSQCHTVGRSGGTFGPDLSEVGLRRALTYLRESLTDPAAHVPDEYQTVTVVTSSGQQISGIRLNEDDYSVQVRDLQGNLRSYLKTKVKEVKREKRSLMPAYNTALTAAEIDNLVAYLSSLRGTK